MRSKRVLSETIVFLSDVARHFPYLNVKPWRLEKWMIRGIKVGGGKRITLEYGYFGGSRVTSLEAIHRFCEAKTEAG